MVQRHLLVPGVSNDQAYIVLCCKFDTLAYVGRFGDIDSIVDIIADLTRSRPCHEWVTALIGKEWCLD